LWGRRPWGIHRRAVGRIVVFRHIGTRAILRRRTTTPVDVGISTRLAFILRTISEAWRFSTGAALQCLDLTLRRTFNGSDWRWRNGAFNSRHLGNAVHHHRPARRDHGPRHHWLWRREANWMSIAHHTLPIGLNVAHHFV